ncbi:1-deoxy-D-xylulose-5-phosphate reductoisomerase [Geotoga petraea]|jgi:1-deoxy-D-xylulose-5-phosphate reductoisomerase|uniref:1-deoxy-D-xylulose 5-phosphate reductoisomerase n=1 Tax=Geotoga petraea TaxID=28234 RepID=A0A1G6JWC5_9BACT|nr:1-deoxy-D-xylulose-5-phosphate reductoisomerase [Geotoga petraea]TGG88342.1 1-deoxy-D-xylulose-5-phosphate reductoisomerase [Geotoga petraea]SDC23013.1 1-deoxy-D-xylulose 5-phosphate reductoisomerase [Geotoga petraea]
MKTLFITGITGSIGTQALDVLNTLNDSINLIGGSVNSNWRKLKIIIEKYGLKYAALAKPSNEVPNFYKGCKIFKGDNSTENAIEKANADISLIATSGAAGLAHTIQASKYSKRIALANKESLVLGGDLILNLFKKNGNELIPVDSEHSAIFQLVLGENSIDEIYLTASGGSLRDKQPFELKNITKEQVLNHPTWSMGKRITVDSASMVNKILEVIEAYYLFNTNKIKIFINRNSHIHSMVKFKDGVIKMHFGKPNMKVPIAYAFTYPDRLYEYEIPDIINTEINFEEPDIQKYPVLKNLDRILGNHSLHIALNASDEVAVDYFLKGNIKYLDINKTINYVINEIEKKQINIKNFQDIFNLDNECRKIAEEFIKEEL